MIKLNSCNEWDQLRSVVVGSAQGAAWPRDLLSVPTTWTDTPIPQGPVPQWILDETERELDNLATVLMDLGVEVLRPHSRNFNQGGGMYNYCPRDTLLVVGDTVVVPQMMMPIRNLEVQCLDFVLHRARSVVVMPETPGMVLDAANVCRVDDTLLVLESASGSPLAIEWLQVQFPNLKIESCNFYSGAHIDSTIVPLRPGLVLLNGSRVNESNCPQVFQNWQKIWIHDVAERDFYQYPYASKWIGINMLVVNPGLVIVDSLQTELIVALKQHGIDCIPMTLTHSRTLGGGFHCVTLDLIRQP